MLLDRSIPSSSKLWESLSERILNTCHVTWEAVHDILCFDAPEGPTFIDEDVEDQGIDPKDTLSYCWRALKESRSARF